MKSKSWAEVGKNSRFCPICWKDDQIFPAPEHEAPMGPTWVCCKRCNRAWPESAIETFSRNGNVKDVFNEEKKE